jgi:two-component system OmpR family response regulator
MTAGDRNARPQPAARGRLALADLELDDYGHTVHRRGELIELTPTEYRLLRYLLTNAGRVLSRNELLDHVWDHHLSGEAGVLETYISYLRRKVDRIDPPLIHTVRRVGYVIRSPER